jgi:hypothetical protein
VLLFCGTALLGLLPGAASAADACWAFQSRHMCLGELGNVTFYDVVGEFFEATGSYSRDGSDIRFDAEGAVGEAWPWQTSPVTCEWIDRGAQIQLRYCTGESRLGGDDILLLSPFTPAW